MTCELHDRLGHAAGEDGACDTRLRNCIRWSSGTAAAAVPTVPVQSGAGAIPA
jgi:hypothetical protein